MGQDGEKIEGGLYDVRGILGDKKKIWEFSLALWCAMTGLPVEEALRRETEAAARRARYGPPLEDPEPTPWPKEAECADCGKVAYPFGGFREYLTDVPQHRWVQRFRCMHCHDLNQRRKWEAIGRGMRAQREAEQRRAEADPDGDTTDI